MKILISGASGFLGRALFRLLKSKGHNLSRLVRREVNSPDEIYWNPAKRELDPARLGGFDAIINLSGENIGARRWTSDFKKILSESRVGSTLLLSEAIKKMPSPPKIFISGSAIGFYGHRPGESLTEQSSPGRGFFADLAKEWEQAADVGEGTRLVILRTGVVLGCGGGAIKRMLLPFRLGLGGKLGSGRQYMSWIALEDFCRAVNFILENDSICGAANLTAPKPATNSEFTAALAAALNRPAFLTVPGFVVRLIFGEMADEALLADAKILPEKLLDSGFKFKYPDVQGACRASVEQHNDC